ncbi:hypothetical protein WR25_12780 [Diploscapter pachys]|uniref:Succinate dehydrogenase assembly factor 3 n=1 Tax=Diploscapter pachys TaxID=2018661 RepID=A0A2A2KTB0_9BILA|nr:hypothetical protein WR25_12780 [Diploscapter pachys]
MAGRTVLQAAEAIERFPLLLYKRILRLHYALPKEARLMGDTYVRDEFRRHKSVEPAQALVFLKEWASYCHTLSKQLSVKGIVNKTPIGQDFSSEFIDNFSEEQLHQLLELRIEAERYLGRNEIAKLLENSNSPEQK